MDERNYFDRLVKANPQLAESDTITLSIESFKKQIMKAYKQGHKDGANLKSVFEELDKVFGKK